MNPEQEVVQPICVQKIKFFDRIWWLAIEDVDIFCQDISIFCELK